MTRACAIDAPVGTTGRLADGTTGGASGGTADEALRTLVVEYRPPDARAADARRRFLAELDRLELPFDRDADPVHVTASGIVVGVRGTVLHLHRRAGRWLQPGGHVDAGEAPEDAVLRETREETGLMAEHPPGGPRVVHLDVHPAQDHVHLDLRYLLLAPDEDPRPEPGESPQVRWCGWDEAESLADPGLVAALRAARSVWTGSGHTGLVRRAGADG